MSLSVPATTPELALRTALRDLRATADQAGAGDLARGFATLDERLRSRRLLVAVIGEHNRGKSTLINSLLGTSWLPAGQDTPALPPVYVFGGEREHVEMVYDDGSAAESTRDELLALGPDDAASVTYARVALPIPDLHGLVLVDTPGLNDPDTSRLAQTVYELLPHSDLALLVLDSAQALGASEHELIEQRILRAGPHRLVVVLNRDDDLENESQRAAVRERVVRMLTPLLGKEPEVLPYAARIALRARERNDARLLSRSGFPELQALLQASAAERGRILQDAVSERARTMALVLQDRLAPRAQPMAQPIVEAPSALLEAESAVRALATIRDDYMLELRAYSIALRDRLAEETADAPLEDIRRFLPFYIQEQYTDFLREHAPAVATRVRLALRDAQLEDAVTIALDTIQAPAPGLHPYIAPDFVEDSMLITTFMAVIGLAMRPVVTGAVMAIGPLLRMLSKDMREQDTRGALLHAAQAAVLDAGKLLESKTTEAFNAASAAVRAGVQPAPTVQVHVWEEDQQRVAARRHVAQLLGTLGEVALLDAPAETHPEEQAHAS